MRRKLIIQTNTRTELMNKMLKQYDVEVYMNEWDYKEMSFPEESFQDTFFYVMAYLREQRVYVRALEVTVKNVWSKQFKEDKYANWIHGENSLYLEPFSRIGTLA